MSVVTQPMESAAMRAVIAERDEAREALARGIKDGVSIVIPCYQQAQYLNDALQSVANQTIPAHETIVIDDGSDPTHAQTIRALCDHHEARYIRVTNRGLPNARNTGLMLAQGEWFLPLDADDWLDPRYIELTLAEAQRTGADVILTGIQEHGPHRNGKYLAGFDRPWHLVTLDLIENDYNRFYYAQLIRRSLLREVGGYNGLMAGPWNEGGGFEDWDLTMTLMRHGAKYAAVDEYLLNYRTGGASMLSRAEANRTALVAEMRRHHSA